MALILHIFHICVILYVVYIVYVPPAQVKELGAVVYDCSCLAEDLGKIFEAYWYLNQTKTVPAHWPSKYSTLYNKDTPMQLTLNGTDASVYLSVRENRHTEKNQLCHERE